MTRRRDDFCDPQTFAVRMRKESLYPASRSLTQMAYLLGLALAALWVVGGLINIFTSRASDRILTLAVCLFIAVATIFLSRLFREISLMLCDLSDASIRTAAHFEQS
ncbi:DUF4282 domain-containing protein [Ramlibacter sp. MAHUQ-53]|uniref:DUF4282 domain-containing protein n=1 Tax=unclassified Ramlibacter TaxID=2617605 RepID=UPI003630FF2D